MSKLFKLLKRIFFSRPDSDQWFMAEFRLTDEDYYKSIYENLIEIIDVNFVQRNIYPIMQTTRAIIAGFLLHVSLMHMLCAKVLYKKYFGNNKYYRDFISEILFEAHDDKSNQHCTILIKPKEQ